MSHLLDVNFLVALFDARHPNHHAAHRWFGATGAGDWATCAVTETGFVRILSNLAYPTVSASPQEVLRRLALFCNSGGIVSGRTTSRCASPWTARSRAGCGATIS